MNSKDDYKAVYKNVRPVSRTLEEAERNALYACSIQGNKDEDRVEWIIVVCGLVVVFTLVRFILINFGVV
jgi:hypothetical protein